MNFLIRKGKHRSTFSWRPFFKKKVSFFFMFTNSCMYELEESQDALNKLVGFSDGGFDHHFNSFRIAWRFNNGIIELFSYVYRNGERDFFKIHEVEIGEPTEISVEVRDDIYRIVVNNYKVFYAKRGYISSRYKHMLWPYFGGTQVAPHDVKIKLRWKKL